MPSKIRLALCRMYPRATKFQNIVWYCLSKNVFTMESMVLHFKTSYVTVYHPRAADVPRACGFQNIVCYCLSTSKHTQEHSKEISKHRMLLFIDGVWIYRGCLPHFKTSYVTVYLLFFSLCIFLNLHFKTS